MADQICICSVMTSGKVWFHVVMLLGTSESKLLQMDVFNEVCCNETCFIVWIGKHDQLCWVHRMV
jgi:hypothetical protein